MTFSIPRALNVQEVMNIIGRYFSLSLIWIQNFMGCTESSKAMPHSAHQGRGKWREGTWGASGGSIDISVPRTLGLKKNINYFYGARILYWSWSHVPYSHHISFGFSWLWQFLLTPLFLMTLTVLRSTGQIFCKRAYSWNLSGGFLMVRLCICLGRKATDVMCHFHHTISREHTASMIYDYGYCPWSPS